MVTLRIHSVLLTGPRKLRIHDVVMTGASVNPKLRIHDVVMSGSVPLSIRPFATQTVEPLSLVTLQVVNGATSATPDSYTWRQIPDADPTFAPVAFGDNGTFITFIAPAHWLGRQVQFGVISHLGTQDSPEQVALVNVINHLPWKSNVDGTWSPKRLPTRL